MFQNIAMVWHGLAPDNSDLVYVKVFDNDGNGALTAFTPEAALELANRIIRVADDG